MTSQRRLDAHVSNSVVHCLNAVILQLKYKLKHFYILLLSSSVFNFGHVLWLKFVNTALATIISTEAPKGHREFFCYYLGPRDNIISYITFR